jgi:hypothetical protein
MKESFIRPLTSRYKGDVEVASPLKAQGLESPRLYHTRPSQIRTSGNVTPDISSQLLRNTKTLASLNSTSPSNIQPVVDRGKRLFFGSENQLSPPANSIFKKNSTLPNTSTFPRNDSDDENDNDFESSLPRAKLKFAELGNKISDIDLEIQQQHKVRTRKMQHVENLGQKIENLQNSLSQLSLQVATQEERSNKIESSKIG